MKNDLEKNSAVISDQEQQDQPIANQRVVGRREFLKTTAGAAALGAAVLSGVSTVVAEDKKNRVVVVGCENDPEFARAVACNGAYNPMRFEADIVAGIKRLLKKDKDIAVILLECTELSPHAHTVQRLVNMPVWDYTSLTNWIYSGTVRRPFVGNI